MTSVSVIGGDCRFVLDTLPDKFFQCCVTSPPYYGLRDYGVDGQIGLEPTPDEYVAEMVAVFRKVRRVLRDDGTLWLNIGDSYANIRHAKGNPGSDIAGKGHRESEGTYQKGRGVVGVKNKDLLMIPALLAFALRADGWFLRSDIIWHKPNPMPESVRDRPTSAHEHVFLLTKRDRYFYDAEAIRENSVDPSRAGKIDRVDYRPSNSLPTVGGAQAKVTTTVRTEYRNARNVWTIAPKPFKGAHFATMPPDLAEKCIKAGSKLGDHVLDPFGGAGTTGLVAKSLGRITTLIELNEEYQKLAVERIGASDTLHIRI